MTEMIQAIMSNHSLLHQIIQEADDNGLLRDYAEQFPNRVIEGNIVTDEEHFLQWVATPSFDI